MNLPIAPDSIALVCLLNQAEQEIRLRAFIDFTLQQTRTNRYSSDRALQLLNSAWESQKLLWQLRTCDQIKSGFSPSARSRAANRSAR